MLDSFKEPRFSVKLNRALYRLKELLLLQYKEFSGFLISIRLTPSQEELCLFFNANQKVLILFYVDNILLIFYKKDKDYAIGIQKQVLEKYKIKEQGPISQFLSVKVTQDCLNQTITLTYNAYINKITKRFKLEDRTFLTTPLLSKELVKNPREATKQEIKAY